MHLHLPHTHEHSFIPCTHTTHTHTPTHPIQNLPTMHIFFFTYFLTDQPVQQPLVHATCQLHFHSGSTTHLFISQTIHVQTLNFVAHWLFLSKRVSYTMLMLLLSILLVPLIVHTDTTLHQGVINHSSVQLVFFYLLYSWIFIWTSKIEHCDYWHDMQKRKNAQMGSANLLDISSFFVMSFCNQNTIFVGEKYIHTDNLTCHALQPCYWLSNELLTH